MDYLQYFSIEGNKLYFSGKDVIELSKKYRTPLIVYSRKKIEENVNALRQSINFNRFHLHYAMKANFNPAILSILRNMKVGIDAANLNEVLLALENGFSKDEIIASPNNISREEMKSIRDTGVAINFDDISQFKMVSDNPPETVSFRINPGIGKGEFEGTTTGGKGSKFGMPPEVAIEGYRMAMKSKVKKFGIHMMTGSNVLDPSFFRESTNIFFSIADSILKKLGINFDFIDIGGGFGVPYRDSEEPLDLAKTASYIKDNMENFRNIFSNDTKLIAEPGRYIVANTAILLSTVTSIKNYDKYIIGTDTGMTILIRPALYGAVHPVVNVNKFSNPNQEIADIVGTICENTDRIAKGVKIQNSEQGDIIAILNAGAYVSSMSSNYNLMPRAMEVLLDGDNEYIIRKRESLNQIVSSFEVPEHLKRR